MKGPSQPFVPPSWIVPAWSAAVEDLLACKPGGVIVVEGPAAITRLPSADALACRYCGVRSHVTTGNCTQCGAPR